MRSQCKLHASGPKRLGMVASGRTPWMVVRRCAMVGSLGDPLLRYNTFTHARPPPLCAAHGFRLSCSPPPMCWRRRLPPKPSPRCRSPARSDSSSWAHCCSWPSCGNCANARPGPHSSWYWRLAVACCGLAPRSSRRVRRRSPTPRVKRCRYRSRRLKRMATSPASSGPTSPTLHPPRW